MAAKRFKTTWLGFRPRLAAACAVDGGQSPALCVCVCVCGSNHALGGAWLVVGLDREYGTSEVSGGVVRDCGFYLLLSDGECRCGDESAVVEQYCRSLCGCGVGRWNVIGGAIPLRGSLSYLL